MKRTVIAVVTLSGALALAGCGSSSPTTTAQPSTSVSSASTGSGTTSTTSTPSAAVTPGATSDAAELGKRMGAAMVAAKSGKGTLSMSSSAVNLTGTTQFVYTSPTQADTTASMAMMGINLQVVSVGGVIYMKGLPTQLTGGKEWVKVDPKGTDAMSKAMREGGSTAGDPQTMVDALKGGTATVVDTNGGNTHYKITGITGIAGSGATGTTGTTGATMDLTVDSKDLPVKSVVESSGTKVTVDYSDWGTPVIVTAPPADQVGTMSAPKS